MRDTLLGQANSLAWYSTSSSSSSRRCCLCKSHKLSYFLWSIGFCPPVVIGIGVVEGISLPLFFSICFWIYCPQICLFWTWWHTAYTISCGKKIENFTAYSVKKCYLNLVTAYYGPLLSAITECCVTQVYTFSKWHIKDLLHGLPRHGHIYIWIYKKTSQFNTLLRELTFLHMHRRVDLYMFSTHFQTSIRLKYWITA